ncbi:MAG: hypothetical protein OEO77_03125 [Acidimicrobiia bacterium]|nr:hypothetical protein [Acidimicrobiia bacterium]
MGQSIKVAEAVIAGDVAMFDTDRSLSGQDGENFASARDAAGAATFPAELATRLFAADASVDNVYVFSNAISVRRRGGWADGAADAVARLISNFFIVYPEEVAT